MCITALLCLLFCLCGSSLYADWAHPEMVAKVASGEVREARVSWWGFDAKDSTKYLRAAIGSGVPKLIVDRMPSPWIVMPLRAVSKSPFAKYCSALKIAFAASASFGSEMNVLYAR